MKEKVKLEPNNDTSMDAEVPPSNDHPIPRWLKFTYWILPLLGGLAFFLYWNGSRGWLDRGHWKQLQEAANTTYHSSLKR